jgi:hypothetical protein
MVLDVKFPKKDEDKNEKKNIPTLPPLVLTFQRPGVPKMWPTPSIKNPKEQKAKPRHLKCTSLYTDLLIHVIKEKIQ